MKIKVMTFNIHHCKGMDKKVDLYRIANVIENSKADVIGLNEVDKHFSNRSLNKNQIHWLAQQLKLDYAFIPSISINSKKSKSARQYGNALLSRFPIITKKFHSFNFVPGLVEKRSLLNTTIQIEGKLLQFLVTHLSLNRYFHKKQTNYISNLIHNTKLPVILMGDWNMKPESQAWYKLTNHVQDAWLVAGKGSGYTYPSIRPRSRLDYIFISPELKIIETEVKTSLAIASDHLPLTATIMRYKNAQV
ncbi:endonuclease/exonuclease/phosphatase family protein [Chengkuizengella sediminis]|uniref:endonuclease/exonuclease/phosphatase family protein n=1 Tax=Chengkuizengella sediminis TaxID=1885917 RepID=UPI001389B082|nr:endonuclease/exonuclease/phosphatase family protein [Chengkuizengella sediminis]NDI33302.1 endonuclease [Chengkuizengella sediminis]